MKYILKCLGFLLLFTCLAAGARAQETVTAAPDVKVLFTSQDAQLHANKQVVYNIIRVLLEAGQWSRADEYLTERYIQHNPNAASGREGVVRYFTEVVKVVPKPVADRLESKVAFVTAEGDLVTVAFVHDAKDGQGTPYTTTWFDTWRIVDGKADEHWDSALKP